MQSSKKLFRSALLTVTAFSVIASLESVYAADLKVGDDAPDFKLPGIGDVEVELSSYERNKNAVVVFSRAHWCPFCMGQLKQLSKNYKKMTDLDAELIVVFREERDGENGLKRSQKASSAAFPLVLDLGKKKTGDYSSNGFSTYIIDKSGKIAAIHSGTKANRAKPEAILKSLKALK